MTPQAIAQLKAKIDSQLQALSAEERQANWCIPPETGQVLAWALKTIQAATVLELGTSVGYSGLWIVQALLAQTQHPPMLHTLDVHALRQQQAMAQFTAAGVANYVTCHTGEARNVLPSVLGMFNSPQSKTPHAPVLDAVFLDAHKPDYAWYFEQCALVLRPGGLVLADNTTSHGHKMAGFFEAVAQTGWPHVNLPHVGTGLWIVTKPHH
jgi:caffeoyl-CoA O-methyltransferase